MAIQIESYTSIDIINLKDVVLMIEDKDITFKIKPTRKLLINQILITWGYLQ